MPFTARIWKLYVLPLVRPVTVYPPALACPGRLLGIDVHEPLSWLYW